MRQQQVVIIGGGEVFETRQEYLNCLRAKEYNPLEAPRKGWGRTLSERLGDQFEILDPTMPCKYNADYEAWSIWFEKLLPYMKDNIICIGVSLGATFLLKYLAENNLPVKVKSLHLVAGAYDLPAGFTFPGDVSRLKEIDNITIYHSHDDFVVPFTDAQKIHKRLPHAELVEFQDRGHFIQGTFPELEEKIKS